MRKYIVLPNGEKKELSPLTEEEYALFKLWGGAINMSFYRFLKLNKYVLTKTYNNEILENSKIICEPGEPHFIIKDETSKGEGKDKEYYYHLKTISS